MRVHIALANRQALGTHNGMVHILTYEGSKVNSSRPHGASITCLRLDEENDFVATSSVEGQLSEAFRYRIKLTLRSGSHPFFDEYREVRIRLQTTHARCRSRAWVQQKRKPEVRMWRNGWKLDHARERVAGI